MILSVDKLGVKKIEVRNDKGIMDFVHQLIIYREMPINGVIFKEKIDSNMIQLIQQLRWFQKLNIALI